MLVPETKPASVSRVNASSRRAASLWKEIVEPVQPFLAQVAVKVEGQIQTFDPEIAEYARYALTNQGKQLRPVLVALSAGAVGTMNDALVTVAAIIEMVHVATLVHDDVMDEAELRRRRPTLAANWGNQTSVLTGDCLFARAVELAASFPTPDVCRAVAAATYRVCAGEILQGQQGGNLELTRAEYFRVLEMKTAELFALSCELGAALSGGKPAECAALRRYGIALGTAYQIYDDCLDLFGTEAAAGKSLGTDLATGKLTLPVLIAIQNASLDETAQLDEWLLNWNPVFLPRLIELLERHDALNETRAVISEYLDEARRCLLPLPAKSRSGLICVADFLAQQSCNLGVRS
ncbi:MAG: polyprenyl synthetase family protein [Verrucomicrobiia bacterium]